MLRNLVLTQKISCKDLLDGRLEKYGIREYFVPAETGEKRHCLTDGRYYTWVYVDRDGFVDHLRLEYPENRLRIVNIIAYVFHAEPVEENDHRFWGISSREKLEALKTRILEMRDVDGQLDCIEAQHRARETHPDDRWGAVWDPDDQFPL